MDVIRVAKASNAGHAMKNRDRMYHVHVKRVILNVIVCLLGFSQLNFLKR